VFFYANAAGTSVAFISAVADVSAVVYFQFFHLSRCYYRKWLSTWIITATDKKYFVIVSNLKINLFCRAELLRNYFIKKEGHAKPL